MKKNILWVLCVLSTACQSEDCIIIEDKQKIDGKFYFLFGNYNAYTNNPNDSTLFVPDNQQSGEVSELEYGQYDIGDTYCY